MLEFLSLSYESPDKLNSMSNLLPKQVLTKIRETVFGRKELFQISPDDVFLVSYPRSGNTWVRFMLANILTYEDNIQINFRTIHDIIPDSQTYNDIEVIERLNPPRILKSHKRFSPHYPRVIYIVRDGRDVVVSYFDFLKKQGHFNGKFIEFLQTDKIPHGKWHNHVQSWLKRKDRVDFLLVRYEDLLSDPYIELKKMIDFIGITATPAQVDYAVERSTFDYMRQLEENSGRKYGDPSYKFVRIGKEGQWEKYFSHDCREIFRSYANPTLLELGYINKHNW